MKEPLLLPAVALAGGILAGRSLAFTQDELIRGIGLLVLLSLVSALLGQRRAVVCALLAAMLLAGCWTATRHRLRPAPALNVAARELAVFQGCVVTPSAFTGDREQFVLELAPSARARVNLYTKDGVPPPELFYGQRIEFAGRGRAVRNFRNPGSFDYAAFLARSDIYWTIAGRQETLRILPGRCGSPFWAFIFHLRTTALKRLETLYAGDAYSTGMMQAVLIGDSTKLEKVWTENFRRTGTYHALVISGLHVSILAGCLLFLLRLCSLRELPSLIVTCLVAWLYALVSGFTAPVVRAAGGFTLFLGARFLFRRTRLLNLVAAITIVYLFFDPDQVADGSFLLSFLSVVAIGALAMPLFERTLTPWAVGLHALADADRDVHLEPRISAYRLELRLLAETAFFWLGLTRNAWAHAIEWTGRAVFFVVELAVLSAVVQIGLALPMALFFHRLSFSGLTANVIIVPLMTWAVPIGFAAIFTGWRWIARIAALLLDLSRRTADFHARFEPGWRVPDPPFWLAIAFIAALVLLAVLARRQSRWWMAAGLAVGALFAVIVAHPFAPRLVPGTLELTAIDVGQGEALFLALPDGRTMMVDGGGIPVFGHRGKPALDIGEDVIAPYLWSRSIRRLNVLVSTHGHEDHLGGLPALLDDFQPDELWTGATVGSPAWNALRDRAAARRVRLRPLRAGAAFAFGGAGFQVLSPPPEYQPGPVPANNDSLVMAIAWGRHRLLLTGDAEWPMEQQMLARGLPRVDVLKVGHHGSRTSSTEEFVNTAHPAFAVISAGVDNQFGLPHPDVSGRLGTLNVELYRTDQDGLITIRTDGRRITTLSERMQGR